MRQCPRTTVVVVDCVSEKIKSCVLEFVLLKYLRQIISTFFFEVKYTRLYHYNSIHIRREVDQDTQVQLQDSNFQEMVALRCCESSMYNFFHRWSQSSRSISRLHMREFWKDQTPQTAWSLYDLGKGCERMMRPHVPETHAITCILRVGRSS